MRKKGRDTMNTLKVQIKPKEINHFCHILNTCKSDFDIHNNVRSVVDGKSIVGLCSLDISKPLNIQCILHENETLNEIKSKLKDYILE